MDWQRLYSPIASFEPLELVPDQAEKSGSKDALKRYLSHCSNLERSDLFGRLQKPPYEEVHILHLVINCL